LMSRRYSLAGGVIRGWDDAKRHTTRWWVRCRSRDRCIVNRASVGGRRGGRVVDPLPPGRRGGGRLAATRGAGYGPCGAARPVAGSGKERESLAACRIRAASFERVAHLVGALAVADHQDIEDALIDAVEAPEEARSISVSLDRVSVPMEERGGNRRGARNRARPRKRWNGTSLLRYGDSTRRK
jgi:hypothetical protein